MRIDTDPASQARGARAGGEAKARSFDERTRLQDPDYQRALAPPRMAIEDYPVLRGDV